MTFYTVLYVYLEKKHKLTSVNEATECRQLCGSAGTKTARILGKDEEKQREQTQRPKQPDQIRLGQNSK